jgi:hypothetical protein
MARPSSAGVVPEGYDGIDQGWRPAALCHGQQFCGCKMSVAWTIAPHEKFAIGGSTYLGEELIALALQICGRCPVQWECAAFAIATDQRWGTWGMSIDDLHWLHRSKRAATILRRSQFAGEPVQVSVAAARRGDLLGCSA